MKGPLHSHFSNSPAIRINKYFPGFSCCFALFAIAIVTSCSEPLAETPEAPVSEAPEASIVVLGTAQDGGYPQAGCKKDCCKAIREGKRRGQFVASIAIVDPVAGKKWIIDAGPDFPGQMELLDSVLPSAGGKLPNGIFLTHGHIGHYTGLMFLGREVIGASGVPVFALPRMRKLLVENAPWSQLTTIGNISITTLKADSTIQLSDSIFITPFLVPHRGEFTETAGFRITGPKFNVIYIPDIDRWETWEMKIEEVIATCDVALLDGTFFDGNELPGRNIAEVPHPFVAASMKRFASLPEMEKKKVFFIHMNHTNPLHDPASSASLKLNSAGFRSAKQGMVIPL